MTDRPSFLTGQNLLRTIATGLVDLSQHQMTAELVYPTSTSTAYNHLVLQCLERDEEPPSSIPDMARWAATRALREWPLDLPEDLSDSKVLLIDPQTRTPTQECFEWSIAASDPTAELFENQLIVAAMTACRAAGSPESYTAFRRLLIMQPILSASQLARLGRDIDLAPVLEIAKSCYFPVPRTHARDGQYQICPRCGCLMTPLAGGSARCELDRCRRDGSAGPGRPLDVAPGDTLHQLSRPLRMFITGPGLAEIELEKSLADLGVEAEMWPDFDAYDLRITLPDQQVWAVDVKDRANPVLLGRQARPLPASPPYDRGFLVVPQYRFDDQEAYQRIFSHHCADDVKRRLSLLSDEVFLKRVAHAL
jgi:hypothetical protein